MMERTPRTSASRPGAAGIEDPLEVRLERPPGDRSVLVGELEDHLVARAREAGVAVGGTHFAAQPQPRQAERERIGRILLEQSLVDEAGLRGVAEEVAARRGEDRAGECGETVAFVFGSRQSSCSAMA